MFQRVVMEFGGFEVWEEVNGCRHVCLKRERERESPAQPAGAVLYTFVSSYGEYTCP